MKEDLGRMEQAAKPASRQETMNVATPTSRPTYGGWLDQIAAEGRTDVFGLVASAWANAQANGRPKIHAVPSVNRWLSEHPPPGVDNLQQVLHQLQLAYQSADGLPEQVTPGYAPSGPGGNPMAPPTVFQPPVVPPPPSPQVTAPLMPGDPNVAAAFGTAQQQPSPPAVPAVQQPSQPADPAVAGQVPEHPWQMVLLAIERLRTDLAPILTIAAEVTAADQALAASPLTQPSEAQQQALAIAQQQGWTPGPAFEQAADTYLPEPDAEPQPAQLPAQAFYGQHVVPPDFGAMADAATGDEDGEQ